MLSNWTKLSRDRVKELPFNLGGVYALFSGTELVYVGRAGSIRTRVVSHQIKTFDSLRFKRMSPTRAYQTEALLLFKHRPPMNKRIPLPDSLAQIKVGGAILRSYRSRMGKMFF